MMFTQIFYKRRVRSFWAVLLVLALILTAYFGTLPARENAGDRVFADDSLTLLFNKSTDRGLAVKQDGSAIGLLVDTSNYRVDIYSPVGTLIRSTDTSGYQYPSKLVASADGTFWMADNQNPIIYKFGDDGTRSVGLDTGSRNGGKVASFAFDKTETYIYTLERTSSNGRVHRFVKSTGAYADSILLDYPKIGSIYYPSDIAVDGDGAIYVVDRGTNTGGGNTNGIYKRMPDGRWVAITLPSPLYGAHVNNVRVDKVGNVYVNWRNSGIFRFTPQNEEKTIYSITAITGTFAYINGIDLDAAGNLYVESDNGGYNYAIHYLSYISKNVTGVSLDKTSATLAVGETVSLKPTVLPIVAENRAVTWVSSNPSIASVAGGVVTAIVPGQTVITVQTADGGFTASCQITVKSSDTSGGTTPDQTSPKPNDPIGGADSGKVSGSFEDKSGTAVALVISGLKARAWTGKQIRPVATVKAGSKTLKQGTDYTVTYGKNKNIGKGTLTIKGKGNYSGTNNLTFKIVPKTPTGLKLSAGKKSLTVKWKKISKTQKATGYQIQYRYKTGKKWSAWKTKTFKVSYKSKAKTVAKTIKGLKAKKLYQLKIRAYKKVSGANYQSAWSKAKISKKIA